MSIQLARHPGAGDVRHDGLRARPGPALPDPRGTAPGGRRDGRGGRRRRQLNGTADVDIDRAGDCGANADPGGEQVQLRLADARAGHRQPHQHDHPTRLLRDRGRRHRHDPSGAAPTAPPRATCRSPSRPTRRCCSGACCPAGESRKTPIAVAGRRRRSARRCAPPAASSPSPSRRRTRRATPVNFGFGDPADGRAATPSTTTAPGTAPPFLPNSGQSAAYTIINRYDAASTTVTDETDQLFRIGARGLTSSTTPEPHRLAPMPIWLRRHRRRRAECRSADARPALPARPRRRSHVHRPRCAACIRASTTAPAGRRAPTAVTDYSRALGSDQPDTDIVTGSRRRLLAPTPATDGA